ncbi:hypothetical protein [Coleofasciculus sp. G1-WW12-02]
MHAFVGVKHSRPNLSVFYQSPNANASPNPRFANPRFANDQ